MTVRLTRRAALASIGAAVACVSVGLTAHPAAGLVDEEVRQLVADFMALPDEGKLQIIRELLKDERSEGLQRIERWLEARLSIRSADIST